MEVLRIKRKFYKLKTLSEINSFDGVINRADMTVERRKQGREGRKEGEGREEGKREGKGTRNISGKAVFRARRTVRDEEG